MTSVMAFDGVTSFRCLKDVKMHVNVCETVRRLAGLLQAMGESRKKLKTSNLMFSSFIVSWNRNRSALVREFLCNNSLFVGQLYEDKSLALRARDLIFFTTDLQTVNYYTTNHC